MKTQVYNQEGKEIETIELNDRLFNFPWNPDLVYQALRVQEANSRTKTAHVKDRSEVSGGGRKPWRQKHTGRSRQGSTRSPLWAHGGVSHGPKEERDYGLKINKKAKRAAIFSVLSKKLAEGELRIIDSLGESQKTKELNGWLEGFFSRLTADKKGRLSVLLIPRENNRAINRVSRNLYFLKSLSPKSLNVRDLLLHREIILEKEALQTVNKHYIHD